MKAVIDIGSNSVLLLQARRHEDGRVEVLEDRSTVTRLSEGVAVFGVLRLRAIRRTLEVLKEYRAAIDPVVTEIKAVATEAVRLAANSKAFLEPASDVLGVPVRLISGEEEAELSYRSVAYETPLDQPLRVLDIGGGSTELISGTGLEIESAVSHRVGSVRLTESLIKSDPPHMLEVEGVENAAYYAFKEQPLESAEELVGLAGTVTTCAALLLGLERYERNKVDGSRFTLVEIIDLRDTLVGMNNEQRCSLPALSEGRADVIVAGVSILIAAMKHCGAKSLLVRDRGLRYALI